MPVEGDPGMSLRDYFAAKALQGLIAKGEGFGAGSRAYSLADEMMREREKGKEDT